MQREIERDPGSVAGEGTFDLVHHHGVDGVEQSVFVHQQVGVVQGHPVGEVAHVHQMVGLVEFWRPSVFLAF